MSIDWRQVGVTPARIPAEPRFHGHCLIILGSGRCLWDDVKELEHLIRSPSWHVMTVNDVVQHVPFGVKHAYSNHADLLYHWVHGMHPPMKAQFGHPMRHTGNTDAHGAHFWPVPMHGTSALNAVYVGLMMGYPQIILGGIPLDDSGHYFDPPWVSSNFTREVPNRTRPNEANAAPRYWDNAARLIFNGRVKSVSGRTKELLGAP